MPNTSKRCQYRFDPPLVTASTRGCSLWASRTGHNGIDPAMCAPVPKASERGSPHYDSATAVGGGRPKVVRGRGWRKRHGTAFQGPPARRPGLARKGGDGTHLDDDDRERVYRASLHGQDSTDDRLATPVLPRLPLLQPTPGAKSGLTINRRQEGGGLRSSEGDGGGIGMEQRYRDLQPGNENHQSVTPQLRPDEGQACHSHPTPPSSSPTDTWCQVRIDRQQMASTNGRPLEAAGPATMISTQQRACRCQRHPNAAHPTTTPRQRHREKRERKLTWKGIQSVATENEARQANENESLQCGSNRIISATRQGGSTSTPTETTRRHAKVAHEGCRGERMRKDGKRLESLKLQTPGKREGGATNAPTEVTRRYAKIAREGCRGERMKKDGKRLESLKLRTPGKREGATNAPTEVTRRHAEVAREGRCEVRAPKSRAARSGIRTKRKMEMAAVAESEHGVVELRTDTKQQNKEHLPAARAASNSGRQTGDKVIPAPNACLVANNFDALKTLTAYLALAETSQNPASLKTWLVLMDQQTGCANSKLYCDGTEGDDGDSRFATFPITPSLLPLLYSL
ncbi:hypothetical protein H4582DRAFT_2065668 [Lactarius indigo]|nr:hypothetical protein H4582DRAFT_2065668 [Lactarius indigo]